MVSIKKTTPGKKGPKCTVCAHPKLQEINKALVGPKRNFSAIARIFGLKRDSVRRHLEHGHIAEKITRAAEAQEALEADDLLQEIHETETITKTIITAAMNRKKIFKTDDGGKEEVEAPDHETALKALARREKEIELKGKVLGAFKSDKPPGNQYQAGSLPDEEVERRAREILAKRKH
jgi:transposase-like protein